MASPEPVLDDLDAAQTGDAKQPTVAAEAAALALDVGVELIWDGEHSYVVAGESGHPRTFATRSKAFRRWLISKLRAHGDRVPSNHQQWAAVYDLIDSRAEEEGTKATPSIRVAGKTVAGRATIFIDLGDDAWSCVEVTSAGWKVTPHPIGGPYFYRPQRMAALPVPEAGGEPDDLFEYLNAVDPDERMLLLGWLVQANWPRGPYPILTNHGPTGTAKTTRSSVAKALTDPSASSAESPAVTSPRNPPRDERAVIAAARNSRIVAFDNVSYLDQWLSDALCRLATGAEIGGRALYSDFDEAVFTASRPIVLNGIPDVASQPDLADRCVQTITRKPAKRVSEAVFWGRFREEWPQLLGAVLELVSAAIRHWAEAEQRVLDAGLDVRMPDYARIGEAIGVEMGWEPGAFTRAYAENVASAAEEIATNDPIHAPLVAVVGTAEGEWVGTTKELLDALNEHAGALATGGKEWPRTPKALSNKLARLEPALEHAGILTSRSTVRGRDVRRFWTSTPDVHPDNAEGAP